MTWFKSSPQYRALDKIDGEPIEFEWNIFPGFTTLQLCHKVQELLSRLSVTPEKFTAGQWSFLGPGSEKKWDSISEDSPQGEWDRIAELMMFKFGESTHSVFRSTSPLSRGVLKSKDGGKLSIHYCADSGTIETVFRILTSVNQLSLYGAVAEMAAEKFVDENTYTFDR